MDFAVPLVDLFDFQFATVNDTKLLDNFTLELGCVILSKGK
jgi:hypothetical protein